MDAPAKKRAIVEAVELTKTAIQSPTGGLAVIAHPKEVCKFLDDVYAKLKELHADAERGD